MRVEWSDLPVAPGMRAGATRQAISGERLSAVRVVTAPSAVFDGRLHRHTHEQLLVVVRGSVELQEGGERYTVTTGDLAVFRSGEWHGAVGVGADGCEYYEIFSPPRHDQLPGWMGSSPLEFS